MPNRGPSNNTQEPFSTKVFSVSKLSVSSLGTNADKGLSVFNGSASSVPLGIQSVLGLLNNSIKQPHHREVLLFIIKLLSIKARYTGRIAGRILDVRFQKVGGAGSLQCTIRVRMIHEGAFPRCYQEYGLC